MCICDLVRCVTDLVFDIFTKIVIGHCSKTKMTSTKYGRQETQLPCPHLTPSGIENSDCMWINYMFTILNRWTVSLLCSRFACEKLCKQHTKINYCWCHNRTEALFRQYEVCFECFLQSQSQMKAWAQEDCIHATVGGQCLCKDVVDFCDYS